MNTILTTLTAIGRLLLNKAAAIILLIILLQFYKSAEFQAYIEILYGTILVCCVFVGAPLMRLIIFPEAAEYAESNDLRIDLKAIQTSRPARLLHYWFATTVCYATLILCLTASQR